MQKYLIPQILCLICCLFLLSCEKTEVIRQSNGQTFCPLGFRAYPEQGPLDGCGLILAPLYNPSFVRVSDGVNMKVLLKKKNTPFVAADSTPNTLATRYLVLHKTTPKCEFSMIFEKVNMTEATRFSLYIGKTTPYIGTTNLQMGDVLNKIPPGPSPKHPWQVFIQRELSGTYTLGYAADGIQFIAQSGILDFKTAYIAIYTFNGETVFNVDLRDITSSTVGSIVTKSVPIPNDYFGAFGFDILEAQQSDCTERPVEIKLQQYLYVDASSLTRYEDNFECNTIWFQ